MLDNISAVVITKNEEKHIGQCLSNLFQVVKEVIVIDSGSSDKTIDIAKEQGAKVYQQEWLGYGPQKNFGNSKAKNDWILSIDADEILSSELIDSINNVKLEHGCVYQLDRHNHFAGAWVRHSGWYPDWKPRLFQKSHYNWDNAPVHEKLIPHNHRKSIRLKGALLHYSYFSDEDHDKRIMKYARLSAEKLYGRGRKYSLLIHIFSPIARFIKTYVLRLGFLDGSLGFKLARKNAKLVFLKYQYLKRISKKT